MLFRVISFLMLFKISSLKVHVHFQQRQRNSRKLLYKYQLFLDFLSINTFGLTICGTLVGILFSNVFFPPKKCSEQKQWSEVGLIFSACHIQPFFFLSAKSFGIRQNNKHLLSFKLMQQKGTRQVKSPLFAQAWLHWRLTVGG